MSARVGLAGGAAVGCRLLLAGVWLYAGGAKVSDLDGSVRAVKAYRLLPAGAAEWLAAGLPFVELGLAGLLLAGFATRLAAAASALLLVAFLAGIASAWTRGLRIDCGCFGSGGELTGGADPGYPLDLLRDGLFLAAAVFLLARPVTRWSVDRWLAAARDRTGRLSGHPTGGL